MIEAVSYTHLDVYKRQSGGYYTFHLMQASASGEQVFLHPNIPVQAGDTHRIAYSAWDGSSPMRLNIDHGSDGTTDQTLLLNNVQGAIYLPLVQQK